MKTRHWGAFSSFCKPEFLIYFWNDFFSLLRLLDMNRWRSFKNTVHSTVRRYACFKYFPNLMFTNIPIGSMGLEYFLVLLCSLVFILWNSHLQQLQTEAHTWESLCGMDSWIPAFTTETKQRPWVMYVVVFCPAEVHRIYIYIYILHHLTQASWTIKCMKWSLKLWLFPTSYLSCQTKLLVAKIRLLVTNLDKLGY